jgi:hypothetical protein
VGVADISNRVNSTGIERGRSTDAHISGPAFLSDQFNCGPSAYDDPAGGKETRRAGRSKGKAELNIDGLVYVTFITAETHRLTGREIRAEIYMRQGGKKNNSNNKRSFSPLIHPPTLADYIVGLAAITSTHPLGLRGRKWRRFVNPTSDRGAFVLNFPVAMETGEIQRIRFKSPAVDAIG